MYSKFAYTLAVSLFATFAMTGCIAESSTDFDADQDVDLDDEDLDEASNGATATSSCYNPIVKKPASVATNWANTHNFTRYLKSDKYNLHIVGTPSVSDWMMRESCLFNEKIVGALKDSTKRAKMSGFVAYIGTFKDKTIGNNQRNGAAKLLTYTSEEMVCGVSPKDPAEPSRPQIHRTWNVVAHEMGHAIEITLGLQDTSDEVYQSNLNNNYDPDKSREYFAWGTAQSWFGGSEMRSNMPQWERNYFRTKAFNAQNTWQPKCTR